MGRTARKRGGKKRTRMFMKKVTGKDQHEAIGKARRRIPAGYVLKVRTASRAKKPGTWWVVGTMRQRKRASKLVKG